MLTPDTPDPAPTPPAIDQGLAHGYCALCGHPVMRYSYPAPHGPWLHSDGMSRDHNASPGSS